MSVAQPSARVQALPAGRVRLRRPLAVLLGCAAALLLPAAARGAGAAAPAPLTETGTPAFVVLGPDALGLTAPPTDLRRLPDGRLLVLAPKQLALGDGVRWFPVRQAASDPLVAGPQAAVDDNGDIYVGTASGPARLRFTADGAWSLAPASPWTPSGTDATAMPDAMVSLVGDRWVWHSLTGQLVQWRPGQAPRRIGQSDTWEQVFAFGRDVFLSERFEGRVSRLDNTGPVLVAGGRSANAITCTVPYDGPRLLVGTYGNGLQWFDGRRLMPFPTAEPLAGGARINDLCATAGGMFAAAVDNFGIVFFTRDGRIVQTLDRTADHRVPRIKRLLPSDAGVVWGLLDDGIVRVAFPSSVSHFESFLTAGLTTVHPQRMDGRLWMRADGRIYRGIYAPGERLVRLEADAPPGLFCYSLSALAGLPIAGTEQGVYARIDGVWREFDPAVRSLRILETRPTDGRWLYCAHEEVGWLRLDDGRPVFASRTPAPGLTNTFNQPLADDAGRIWFELGSGRVAFLRRAEPETSVTILGAADGVPANWAQVFIFEGRVGFNFSDRIYRFDDATGRIEPDDGFARRFPGVTTIFGRPGIDTTGRAWLTADNRVQTFTRDPAGGWRRAPLKVPVDFAPYYFTFEPGGIVWMHAQHRLARYDPLLPSPPSPPPAAQITHVTLAGRALTLFPTHGRLAPLAAQDNSLVIHFLAPGNPFATSGGFETYLEGAGGGWVAHGTTGSVTYNRLKGGDYVFRVRAVTEDGPGPAAALAFTVRTPWYRTPLAYGAYAAGGIGLVVAIVAGWSFLLRRDRARLERLVAQRTQQLSESEERYRRLNLELERRVSDRTAELNAANAKLVDINRELEAFSYSVSHDLRAPLRNISGFSSLLQQRAAQQLDPEHARFLGIVGTEAVRLGQLIDSLLTFSRLGRAELRIAPVDLPPLIDAIRRELASEESERTVEWRIEPLPVVHADPTLLRQVLTNLLGNALKFSRRRDPAVITIGAGPPAVDDGGTEDVIFVRDNGAGFDPRYLDKLFGVFQRLHSVKDFEGTGIGLANVRRIILRHGGRVWAESRVDAGATFYFALPRAPRPAVTARAGAGR